MRISFLYIVIICSSLMGCRYFLEGSNPFFSMTNIKVPDGTPKFRQGFFDGCSTVFNARGNFFYRTRYKYRVNPDLLHDSEYSFGHKSGYRYCFGYMVGVAGANTGVDSFLTLNTTPYALGMGTGNINDTVNYGSLTFPVIPSGGLTSVLDSISNSGKAQGGTGGKGVFSSHPLWGGSTSGQFLGF